MASVATPDYVVEIVNQHPALPPVAERTPTMAMSAIESWPYWVDVKRVALKEYGMAPEKFDVLLPEYQRYLGLILLGYSPLGMFSFDVDKLWHSHILCTHLWADFCLRLHGRPINHVAQVPVPDGEEAAICTTCRSCVNCSGGGQGPCDAVTGASTAHDFASAYFETFGAHPPAVWSLSEADGCASLS